MQFQATGFVLVHSTNMRSLPGGLPEYIGQYRIHALLGSGGMADVFLAFLDGPAGFIKPVAIKRMKPALAKSQEFVDLFLTEARTASLLSHPNVCQLNELGASDEGGYYMVLEYLIGIPLTKVLAMQMQNPDTIPIGMLIGLAVQACEGIHYAHTLSDPSENCYNIVHRDLSPPNVYMTVNGLAKILDFGISKSTQSVVQTATGQIRGKFTYMSPEQLRGRDLDPRSDVFSLAIMVLELLTGSRLFKRKSKLQTFQAVTQAEIPKASDLNPAIPNAISDAIEIGLARDRDHRFASARAFGTALTEAAASIGGAWPAPSIAEHGEKIFSREFAANRRRAQPSLSRAIPVQDIAVQDDSGDLTIVEDNLTHTEDETRIQLRKRDEI